MISRIGDIFSISVLSGQIISVLVYPGNGPKGSQPSTPYNRKGDSPRPEGWVTKWQLEIGGYLAYAACYLLWSQG